MRWKHYLLLLLLLPLSGLRAATLWMPDTTITAVDGTLVGIPIYVDFDIGEDIHSFELELDFPNNWQVVGVDLTGSLISFWGAALEYNPDGDGITLAVASDPPMAGDDILLHVEALIDGNGWMSFVSVLMNEGAVVPVTTNGYFTQVQPPTLTVIPTSAIELVVGEMQDYDISGGSTPPITWDVENPATGMVDMDGLFTATAQGTNRVLAEDAVGVTGSGGAITIYSFRMYPGSASAVAGENLILPIELENPQGFSFSSFEFELNLGNARLELNDVIVTGSLCESWASYYGGPFNDGYIIQVVAAADEAEAITGEGTLIFLELTSTAGNALNTSPYFNSVYLDEEYAILTLAGSIHLDATNSFYVTPNTGLVKRGATLQFSVVGTPNGPVTWSTLNPAVGTIDGSGLFLGVAGGTTQVAAVDPLFVGDTTGDIDVYDVDSGFGDVFGVAGEEVLVPVLTDPLDGDAVLSWELEATFDPDLLDFIGFETSGTICETWSEVYWVLEGNNLTAAAAGPEITSPGTTLVYLRFMINPIADVGETGYVNFASLLYNEGSPVVQTYNGSVTVTIAPLALAITVVANDVYLDWSDDPIVLYYHVYRSTEPYTGFVEIATTPDGNYVDVSAPLTEPWLFYYVTAELP